MESNEFEFFNSSDESNFHHKNHSVHYHVFHVDFDHVKIPFIISIWIISSSLAKVAFHLVPKISKMVPESCLLTILGVLVGVVMFFSGQSQTTATLTPKVFFMFLLPPIVLDAGYCMPNRLFFNNIGTILLMAIVGTIFNSLTIGACLYGFGTTGIFGDSPPGIFATFLFSSLISAVDPVAVIAIFEEIHVDEILYIVVFGESLLNDAVTVVLYNMFEIYVKIGEDNIQIEDFAKGVASFFVVSLGGTVIGVIWAYVISFFTRFTHHVTVLEPLLVILFGYLSYLNAEIFHMSGILAITFYGIICRGYVSRNICSSSRTTLKYSLKMMSSAAETIIFMFLGVETVHDRHVFNWPYIGLTLVFCLLFRSIGVVILVNFVNRYRLHKLDWVDQFVLSYGGLRGAVAVVLAFLINEELPYSQMFVTTTLILFYWTVFIQGITIKPLVKYLHVKTQNSKEPTLHERIFDELMDHAIAGMEEILGEIGFQRVQDMVQHLDDRYIKPIVLNNNCSKAHKIIGTFKAITDKEALHFSKTHPRLFSELLNSGIADIIECMSSAEMHKFFDKLRTKKQKQANIKKLAHRWKNNSRVTPEENISRRCCPDTPKLITPTKNVYIKSNAVQSQVFRIGQINQIEDTNSRPDSLNEETIVIVTPFSRSLVATSESSPRNTPNTFDEFRLRPRTQNAKVNDDIKDVTDISDDDSID